MDFIPTASITQSGIERVDSKDGLKLAVRVAGVRGTRIPLIMLHGLQSHSGWFVQSQAFLAGLGTPVYAMDRRGSGLSDGEAGDCRDFHEMSQDIHSVVEWVRERHGVAKVHVFGHCFGTIPGTLFAVEYPDLVASLIQASSGIHTRVDLPFGRKLELAWSKASRRQVRIPIPLRPEMFSDLDECVQFIEADDARLRTATGSLYLQVVRSRRHIHLHRRRLTMPLFMASAGDDPICDTEANERFFWSLPTRQRLLIRYDRSRHVIEFSEQRDDFFRDLSWWMERFGGERYAEDNQV
jgi:pimeloyl-ACP methyl ester carboxylesterase